MCARVCARVCMCVCVCVIVCLSVVLCFCSSQGDKERELGFVPNAVFDREQGHLISLHVRSSLFSQLCSEGKISFSKI